ncbi:RnfABCDGE type electron transport complex subunit D [Halarsenatibacter silvermanii]|uniref:Ion-translocating oxidoreductase complex subunit D n=1 Tax=Halarsenatibacter silvermanii TaxID=321763 RepID=A0A1G9MG48_9FIRM|nr:RnfABCDGE type electron transport complex subunit D [Halarsenatibacter silvermanii]SDL73073.1 electron transport complex protein RnfD [Halarsenatibacter silvermanii]
MSQEPELVITDAPHLITDGDSTDLVMIDVIIALIPATLASVYLFGLNSVRIILASVITAMLIEAVVLQRWSSLRDFFDDGSAAVTGLLLALTLPPDVSPFLAAVGAALAIILGKMMLGGLGNNLFNPALVGRGIMLALWPASMTTFTDPVDGATAATALAGGDYSYWEMFLGSIPGSLGETSALLLFLGGVYLFFRGRIGWKIPLSYIVTVGIFTPLMGGDVILHLFSGGLIMGAIYMATDMVTSPVSSRGKLVFGFGCGFLTIIIRMYATLPEGVTYAILIMNALVPLLDKLLRRRAFGEVETE